MQAKASSSFVLIGLFLTTFTACESESRAHHKVHNLALYPERHSWCTPTPIRQEISSHVEECQPLTIDNVVCLGACFSYSVPRAQDDAVIPPYCDACRPTQLAWTAVSLNCTKADTGEHYFLARNVELITNCSCVDCNDNSPRADANNEASGDSNDSGEAAQSREFGTLEANELEEDEDLENSEDDLPIPNMPDFPTLHKLKSVSAEMKGIHKIDTEAMIKDNKITPDNDVDNDLIRSRRERDP